MIKPPFATLCVELKNNSECVILMKEIGISTKTWCKLTDKNTMMCYLEIPFDEVNESINSWLMGKGISRNDILRIGFDY
jgi:hypothetical protein